MVESQHRGHVVVVDHDGVVVGALGDPEAFIYPRSAVKPFQALGMLEAGLDFSGPQLALASASHSGEPFQVEMIEQMLQVSDLSRDDLLCPPDLPYGEAARTAYVATGAGPQRILMNCSGKHAAMLRVCVLNDWSTTDYLAPDHELQQHLRNAISAQVQEEIGPGSTDGCGAPLWPMTLAALARGFVHLGDSQAGMAVVQAFREFPAYAAGPDRDVTALLRDVPGLMTKDGAEAVQALTIEIGGQRYGAALKIEDGGQRARPVVAAAVLAALGVDVPVVREQMHAAVLGGGIPVGSVRPAQALLDFALM